MTARNPPKRRASSRERIERILDATETLLGEQGLTELSMYAIAEQAQIPPSSVYHFFPQVGDVLSALAERVFVELDALLQEQAELAHEGGWPALVERIEARFQSYYQANPAASELLLGAHELAAVRQADRQHDLQLGQRFRNAWKPGTGCRIFPTKWISSRWHFRLRTSCWRSTTSSMAASLPPCAVRRLVW